MNDLTCAHKSLPFDRILKVTENRKAENVWVNDRGPFILNREIDLTTQAANKTTQLLLKNDFENVVFQTSKSTGVVRVVIKNVSGKEVEKEIKKYHYGKLCEFLI